LLRKSGHVQVDAGVRYLRTNSLQVDISDTVTCCQKTVSNTVTRVVEALNDPDVLRRFIIFKPDDPEWCRRRADEFARIGLLSNVVGCIDGTLLPIWTPSIDGSQYVSRKGYSRLNVCLIWDAVGRILYVNSAFPGSVHDSYVWNNCAAGHMFRDGRVVSGYQLLGDCGYANGRGIMTPYRPTSVRGDQRKRRFNREHCRMRSTVERTICTWKRRFRILNDLRLDPDFAVKAVIACAVLHNMGYCINATNMRLLGRRKARVMHPPDDVVDIRAFRLCSIDHEKLLKMFETEERIVCHNNEFVSTF
ncbi:transposase, IS4 family, partial [Oesophagostomum dentatum]